MTNQGEMSIEFIKFCIVGMIATAIDTVLFYIFRLYFNYQLALVLSYMISLSANYFLTVCWTFNSKPNRQNGVGVVSCHLFNLFVVRMGLMWFFVNQMAWDDKFAYIPTLIISVITNYFIIKYVIKRTSSKC